jgi:hypothetical protein
MSAVSSYRLPVAGAVRCTCSGDPLGRRTVLHFLTSVTLNASTWTPEPPLIRDCCHNYQGSSFPLKVNRHQAVEDNDLRMLKLRCPAQTYAWGRLPDGDCEVSVLTSAVSLASSARYLPATNPSSVDHIQCIILLESNVA